MRMGLWPAAGQVDEEQPAAGQREHVLLRDEVAREEDD